MTADQRATQHTGDDSPGSDRGSPIGIVSATGPAGSALAARLAASGTSVVIGSRDVAKAEAVLAHLVDRWGPAPMALIHAADNAAAAACDLVVLATDATHASAVAIQHRTALSGKVVVSMAAEVTRTDRGMAAVLPLGGSIAVATQRALPTSKIVAALHHVPAAILGNLAAELDVDVMIVSDHADAVAEVTARLGPITVGRFLDAGPLANAPALEAMTAALISINRNTHGENSLRLVDTSAE
jgi:NADPH-dependent F420 reductase